MNTRLACRIEYRQGHCDFCERFVKPVIGNVWTGFNVSSLIKTSERLNIVVEIKMECGATQQGRENMRHNLLSFFLPSWTVQFYDAGNGFYTDTTMVLIIDTRSLLFFVLPFSWLFYYSDFLHGNGFLRNPTISISIGLIFRCINVWNSVFS